MAGTVKSIAYAGLLQDIKSRIRAAQYKALKAVNKEWIALCRDIGKTMPGVPKLAPLVQEIGWSHNLAILEKCEGPFFKAEKGEKHGQRQNAFYRIAGCNL